MRNISTENTKIDWKKLEEELETRTRRREDIMVGMISVPMLSKKPWKPRINTFVSKVKFALDTEGPTGSERKKIEVGNVD